MYTMSATYLFMSLLDVRPTTHGMTLGKARQGMARKRRLDHCYGKGGREEVLRS